MASERKTDILQLLRGSKEYISGQQICDSYGISRTAVWKIINQLKEEGYVIEAVQNKGYLLSQTPDVLSESELKSRIKTKFAGKIVKFFDTVDSTNTKAKHLAEEGTIHGTLVVADRQISGKGRRGRSWESPSGTNIFMTLVLRPSFAPGRASMITLVMALSISQAIESVTGLKALIKWPNDIVVNGKKVVGILTEMNMETDYIQYLVCGVGINVNQESFSDEISDKATSLFLESGNKTNRAQLIEAAMKLFENNYNIFCKSENMSGLLKPYNQSLINNEKQVRVLDPKGEFEGISHGIDAEGELIVEKTDGKMEKVYAGEVSVRGMFGYV